MRSCLIVGAGMAGLTAAGALQARGWDVMLVDKGRGPGGRMATRRIGNNRFDHGAQFFTVRDPRFRRLVNGWERDGLVAPWFIEDGHTRYRATDGMNALAKHLAKAFEVRTETKIVSIESGWRVVTESGEAMTADTLIVTAPAPQAIALLPPGIVPPALSTVEFDPCFALLVQLQGSGQVPEPGYVRPDIDSIDWIADNCRKGVSAGPGAITIHASANFTRKYLEAPREQVAELILQAAAPFLGEQPVEWQLHRWLYSKPLPAGTPMCLFSAHPAPFAIAGDAFAGGRVEGAFLSGLAAAEALAGS